MHEDQLIRQFIAETPWTSAKHYPESPHEYHILADDTRQDDFYRLVAAIHIYGKDRIYEGQNYHYLQIYNYEYWAMLTSDNRPIINRRRKE